MSLKFYEIIRNIAYAVSSNAISLVISTVVTLIVPKLIGVEEYGYWQLYVLYASFIGFFQFGWNDGIYLRYAGENYKELDKSLFYSQFWTLFGTQIFFSIIISVIGLFFSNDPEKKIIVLTTAVAMIAAGVRAMPLFILQATNRIKEYAIITTIDKLSYIIIIIVALIFGIRNYQILIVADLIGKIISLFLSTYYCKDIVFRKVNSFALNVTEIMSNIQGGVKLMIANLSSTLVIGIVRWGIEDTWDIATFGKVSLTLSISSSMMIFINAIGIIIFPILRNTKLEKLPMIYRTIRDILMAILFGMLILYYPLKEIITIWLPNYAESFKYMALIFPIIVYEGKMSLLINTYFKTLRKEQTMLIINVLSMFLSLVVTFFTTRVFINLDFAILSILLLLVFRVSFSEIVLASYLKISIKKDVISEWILTFLFVFFGWKFDSWLTLYFYLLAFCLYLIFKRKDFMQSFKNIRFFIKK
ncbi:Membrane protein involved in the export of O-antigen and teichoic acid [Carnobacterium alterfunditum]|uniref:Membrane protein involved in the export of O-antigen and teichoic acid n=1 Tax=Carnobacterium alterfunditum TaxID=28230 RepID=A0A1N6HHV5_9LACT|nr:flippase [Carnobacterium alterfunditum]SIO19342.1 Membrane protein involved in the export of O-antigen and teichoic acid [Carnobacterium alterfunditum]